MALQIRRGTDTQRQALSGVNTPIAGELLYSTDNKKLHIGDGTSTGGTSIGYFGSVAVSGQGTIRSTGVNEALTVVAGANISLTTDANTGTLTIAAASQELNTGSLRLFQNNITSVNSNEDINIDPSGTGKVNVVGNLTATTLTGALTGNVTGNIASASNNNISITPNGTGTIQLNGSTNVGNTTTLVDGNLSIFRNNYSLAAFPAFLFAQHHSTQDSVNFTFYRTRGTGLIPTAVLNGDELADIVFTGHDGTTAITGATLSAVVDGVPTLNNIPTKFILLTNNGSATAIRAELSAAGIWKVNSIAGLTTTLNITGNLTGSTVSVSGLQLFQNNIIGLNSNEDIVITPAGTGGVKIDKVAAPTATTTASSIGYLGMPVSAVTTTGTLTLADAGKHVYVNTTTQTITIPANSTVAYPIGTTIAFIAGPSATTVTIAIATDTMYLAGTGTTGSRTLAAFGMASAVKIASTSWIINGTGLT